VLGLKSAGAVIIGKTTTTEFGWKSPGDCPLHGITRNPGTASGRRAAPPPAPARRGRRASAAARRHGRRRLHPHPGGLLRAGGVKPSYGRVPQWPHGAFSGVAVAGPMARTVRDAALMLSAMAQPDLRDPFCLPEEPRDWRRGIEDGVAGLRVALVRRLGFDPPLDAEGEDGAGRRGADAGGGGRGRGGGRPGPA
jgi:aspartyl-tRNA(Asn)/glutamyl-tRNA(Gln) amidotransferase subunit A